MSGDLSRGPLRLLFYCLCEHRHFFINISLKLFATEPCARRRSASRQTPARCARRRARRRRASRARRCRRRRRRIRAGHGRAASAAGPAWNAGSAYIAASMSRGNGFARRPMAERVAASRRRGVAASRHARDSPARRAALRRLGVSAIRVARAATDRAPFCVVWVRFSSVWIRYSAILGPPSVFFPALSGRSSCGTPNLFRCGGCCRVDAARARHRSTPSDARRSRDSLARRNALI